MIRILVRFSLLLPRALDRLHLQWALAELSRTNPFHPDVPWIVRRINELENAS